MSTLNICKTIQLSNKEGVVAITVHLHAENSTLTSWCS